MKSETDIYWNDRAKSVAHDVEVNLMDIFQRNLEYDYICKYLESDMKVLEVGCGNGISTNLFREHVSHVNAFDLSENMISRAKAAYGEKNNRFLIENVLDMQHLNDTYDTVICVRVLINLRDLSEQVKAIENLSYRVKTGGKFILVEGFTEGFNELNKFREQLQLPPITPANINFYSSIQDLMPALLECFELEEEFHLGSYDYLTRIVYPKIAGVENVKHNTNFSEQSEKLSRVFNDDAFKQFSRIKGLLLRKL